MNLISIEPTPSPNSMKLNVNETLPRGRRFTYAPADADSAPEPLKSMLLISGVRSLFRTADFIALDRKPGADWAAILARPAASCRLAARRIPLQRDRRAEPTTAKPMCSCKCSAASRSKCASEWATAKFALLCRRCSPTPSPAQPAPP